MRKSTKIAVVLAAAALLVAGFAFTTLAKGWVKEAEGLYYYEDEYGMKVYNEWKKDTDANGLVHWYYLGDDGYMVTNSIVEYGEDKYWVDGDGSKVTEKWIKVPADQEDVDNYGVDYRWFYFKKATGQAVKGKQTIDGETYFFSNEGKMLFGYVNGDDFTMETDVAKAYDGNAYKFYCGSNDEGKALKGDWRKETNVDGSAGAYEEEKSWWAFYQTNGKRADDTLPNGALWKGQRYYFDANGKMVYGWKTATVATYTDKADDVAAKYFGDADDGKMVKKAWAYVKPDGASADDKFWFYFDNTGASLAFKYGAVQKINGKFYAFAKAEKYASKMLSGTVELTFPMDATGASSAIVTDAGRAAKIDLSEKSLAQWLAEGPETIEGGKTSVYYFSGDEKNDGSLKKNITFSQEFKDDTYTLAVGADGALKDGYMKKEKKYYRYGYLLAAAEDMRYEVINVNFSETAPQFALLGVAGTEVTTGTVVDADGSYYYVVKPATATDVQKIYKADSSLLSAAKVISSFKKDGEGAKCTIDGTDYKVTVDDSQVKKIGYIILGLTK